MLLKHINNIINQTIKYEYVKFYFRSEFTTGDFTGFTFFIGSVSIPAAIVFLVQHGQVDKKFKDSMLVAALITGIAAVHYYYMRDQWAEGLGSPTELRYVDWILTVPLMVVEFALLTGVGMRKLFWASVVMLVTGYFGESRVTGVMRKFGDLSQVLLISTWHMKLDVYQSLD